MNREILFRGKRVDNGEWVYGYVLIDNAQCSWKNNGKCKCQHDGTDAFMFVWNDYGHGYDDIEVVPDTIGQYTGIKDKNGKRIFENDIIQYDEEQFPFEFCGPEIVTWDYGVLSTIEEHLIEYCEIIGNIHDNPELIDVMEE